MSCIDRLHLQVRGLCKDDLYIVELKLVDPRKIRNIQYNVIMYHGMSPKIIAICSEELTMLKLKYSEYINRKYKWDAFIMKVSLMEKAYPSVDPVEALLDKPKINSWSKYTKWIRFP